MKQPSALLFLIAVMQTTALTAGSITISSGNVQTTGNQVTTGSNAHAQATVDQHGSVVRLGSNTSAQVGDRGDVSLSRGVVLVSSGDGFLRRSAVQVTTPQGDVTVRGSAIVAAMPDGSVKMTCLEGSVRGDLGGQNMALNPGHLIVQRPEGTRDTVQVNLNTLTHSSTLLDSASFKQSLPAAPEIHHEVAQQAQSLGATLTLARNDVSSTQKVISAGGTELRTAEAKSDGPGFLTRIFGGGSSSSQSNVNSNASTMTSNSLRGSPSLAQTTTILSSSDSGQMRISGEVSGSNVFLAAASGGISTGAVSIASGAEGQSQRVLTLAPYATTTTLSNSATQLVLANGSTNQIVNQGSLTLAGNTNNTNALSGASLVKAGSGTVTISNVQGATLINSGSVVISNAQTVQGASLNNLVISNAQNVQGATRNNIVISNAQNVQGATLNSGTLVLQGAAAQQFTSGNLTVNGPGGTTLTPITGSAGVLTFQSAGGGTTPPASAP